MKYRRKPSVIEAVQFTESGADPVGVFRRPEDNTPYVVTIHDQRCYLSPGDWIAPEPDGMHFYPIKPDIFAATYEFVEDEPRDRPLRTTHTYAILELPPDVYATVRAKLEAADYWHAIHRDSDHEVIDMTGLAIMVQPTPSQATIDETIAAGVSPPPAPFLLVQERGHDRVYHVAGIRGDCGENPGVLAVCVETDPSPNFPVDGRIILGSPSKSPLMDGHIPDIGGFCMGPEGARRVISTLQQAVADVETAMSSGKDAPR